VLVELRFSMINKVATTHCSFLRRQIKREDISTNAVSVTKTELYTILRDVCIVSRDVCIVSNRLTCIDAKLSEMEILAQPLSLPFIIENLRLSRQWRYSGGRSTYYYFGALKNILLLSNVINSHFSPL
jgi:hypothetical protein